MRTQLNQYFISAAGAAAMMLVAAGCLPQTDTGSAQFVQLAPPEISFSNMAPMLAENKQYELKFSVTADSRVPVERLELYLSENGGAEFTLINRLPADATAYFWTTPDKDVENAVLRLKATNTRGKISLQDSKSFVIRKRTPTVTETALNGGASQLFTKQRTASIGGTCEMFSDFPAGPGNSVTIGVKINDFPTPATFEAPCVNGRWQLPVAEIVSDQKQSFFITQTDPVGHVSAVIAREWYSDTTAPVFSRNFKINEGAAVSRSNFVKLSLEANDNLTHVSRLCLKYNSSSAPTATDPCWFRVGRDSLSAYIPGKQLRLNAFDFQIGYVPGNYSLRAWAEDQVGNVSTLIAPAGSVGTDLAQIAYHPGKPALITNFQVARDNWNRVLPVDPVYLRTDGPMTIQWNVSAAVGDEPLPSNPVSLYYTQDNSNYTRIATSLANAGSGCADGFTGCYSWQNPPSPASGYVRVRIVVTNDQGMRSAASSAPLNLSRFKLIAGNTDDGSVSNIQEAGANAAGAIFHAGDDGMYTKPGGMIVADDGSLFINDAKRGLLRISPRDTNLTVFLPVNGRIVNGPVSTASIGRIRKLMLDFKGRLLVAEDFQLRRVDLATNTITTIIGGGTSDELPPPLSTYPAPGADPLATDLSKFGQIQSQAGVSLPNGDLYFYTASQRATRQIFVLKESNQTLYTIPLSGTVSFSAPVGVKDLSLPGDTQLQSFGIVPNPETGAAETIVGYFGHAVPGGRLGHLSGFDPITGARMNGQPEDIRPSPDFYLAYADGFFLNGRDGTLYELNRFNTKVHLHRYDRATKIWIRVVGNEMTGACPDGTLAASCPIDPIDAHIGAQSRIYIMDRGGVIRAVDDDGKMLTVAGQSRSFGDGIAATSARFNRVISIAKGKDHNVIALDATEHRIREFSPGGIITTLAGNGNNDKPLAGVPAVTQPISGLFWGNSSHSLAADPATGDIYFHGSSTTTVSRLSRTGPNAGMWERIAGGGPKNWAEADGLKGTEYYFTAYPLQIFGFNGTELGVTTDVWGTGTYMNWNPATKKYDIPVACPAGCHFNSFMKHVNIRDGLLSHLSGVAGSITNREFLPDGEDVAVSQNPGGFYNLLADAHWDPDLGWLMLKAETSRIVAMKPGAKISTFATLAHKAGSFAYAKTASSGAVIYYCNTLGSVRKRNVTAMTEMTLELPPGMTCAGRSMLFTGDSIIFPVKQNNTFAIGEISDVP